METGKSRADNNDIEFFGLGLGLFFVCQGYGRGFAAMIANAVRLLVSATGGIAAVYWLGLGVTGLFAAIAGGFCIYAALTTLAVIRISPPSAPSAQAAAPPTPVTPAPQVATGAPAAPQATGRQALPSWVNPPPIR